MPERATAPGADASARPLGRLDLLASAVAGVPLAVAPGLPGEPSWTDGAVVFVDPASSPGDQVSAVSLQASLLAAGSLAPGVVGGLDRRGPRTARYLAVEGHRALAANRAVLPPAACSLIDPEVAGRSASPEGSLAIARGREPVPSAPALFGTIRPGHASIGSAPGDPLVTEQPLRAADQPWRELDDGPDPDDDRRFDPSIPVGGGGAVGRLLQRLLGAARAAGTGSPGADAGTHRSTRGTTRSRAAVVSNRRVDGLDTQALLERPRATYPEWDRHRGRYRADWCTVTEVDVVPAQAPAGPGPEPYALRRSLARLGLDRQRRHRQPQGDDIDIDATVEARVELAAGSAPTEAIYIDRVRDRREVAVLILLDVSGSAGEPGTDGRAVHEHQREAALALTQVLADLGDRVALYGFRSQGRTAVHVLAVKRFGERFGPLTRRRLDATAPGAYTRLGAAIRHGASVLEAEGGTTRRLLVVLSDGFAYDHGYEADYGEADARRALAEARRRGTACLCLSIGADTEADALRRVFGTAAHASFGDVDQVAAVAGPLFRSALSLADAQRRQSQRRRRARDRATPAERAS